jgi:cellobiose dehydrogenase (acceptor)
VYFQPPDSDWDDFHPKGWKSADVKNATAKLLGKQKSVVNYSQDGKFYLQSGYEAAKAWIVDKAGYTNVVFNDVPNQKTKAFGRPAYNYVNGQRGGSAVAHLQDALKLSNFHLATGVRVLRIIHTKGQASGVLATVNSKNVTLHLAPKGRVIVSAGAIASPGLLMLSGVGPQATLSQLHDAGRSPYNASNWVVNPAVGQGLFDNPNTFLVLSGPTIKSYVHSYDNPIPADKALYLDHRSGPYAFASQTSAFWTYIANEDGTRTGVQGTIDSSGYRTTANNTITLNVYGTSGLLSTGYVGFTNDGKFTPVPAGDVYYGHPRDGMNIAKFIHDIFQKLPPSTPQKPAANGLTPLNLAQNSTVDQIYAYITSFTDYTRGSVQHWSSSCRIGACVDVNTKVVGTANIHVADASIVAPLTVNPMFGIMVAAEKAAERILAT